MAMCEEHIRLSTEVAVLGARVEDLEEYKDKQNGALLRLTDRVDNSVQGIQRWLTGLLGGMVVSLILLVANLVVTFGMRR